MLHLNASCRTCMKNNSTLIDLYQPFQTEEFNQNVTLAECFIQCLSLQISRNDGLPESVCPDCAKTLGLIYNFRIQVLETEQAFKSLLSKNVIKIDHDYNEIKNEIKCKNEYDDNDFDYFDNYIPEEKLVPKNEIKEKIYECNTCLKIYTDKKKFLKHLKSHHKDIQCTYCNKKFRKQSSFNSHLKNCKHNKCNLCLLTFDTEDLFWDHMKIHSDIKIKTEEEKIDDEKVECDKLFNNNESLAMHTKKHNEVRTNTSGYQCDKCNKVYKYKQPLKRHIATHTGTKSESFSCTYCNKQFQQQEQLQEHFKSHDPNKLRVCSFCNKAFSQLCNLQDHMRTHTGETPFLCSECGKGFGNRSNLRQHMQRHSGVKPFTCSFCPKTFCTKGQMTTHISSHTGVHPYGCEKCGATFTKPSSLKKHSLIHLSVRPFACESCDKRFTCKDHLKRHSRIHTGEKPYKCDYCDRAFTQSNDRIKHMRSHIGQNVYECSVCSKRFRLKSDLKKHYPVHYIKGKDVPVVPINQGGVAPVLVLPIEEQPAVEEKDFSRAITITINRNDSTPSGLAGDITINIGSEKK